MKLAGTRILFAGLLLGLIGFVVTQPCVGRAAQVAFVQRSRIIELAPIEMPDFSQIGEVVQDKDFRDSTGYRTLVFVVRTSQPENPFVVFLKLIKDQGAPLERWYRLGEYSEVRQAGVIHEEFIFVASRVFEQRLESVLAYFDFARFESDGIIRVSESIR